MPKVMKKPAAALNRPVVKKKKSGNAIDLEELKKTATGNK